MSRSSKRLESFREVTKRKRDKKAAAPPAPWTWKEKLSVWGTIAGVMLLTLIPFFDQSVKHRQRIDKRIERWKAVYQLSDEQGNKVREIELEHHKGESPLSTSAPPTASEDEAHNRRIAGLMSAENGRKFLEHEAHHGGKP